ncbi:galectin-related protein [Xenopus laevis]|uniref:Galectin n=2 Tax=Xenopus laevis TaxID=8355 RepID=A0A974H8J4_XENLA|nr:galectin-related protein [Xenopus laevis]OCT68852.1 hypothetical protein XELAEV_18040157mg [Xenopus laevis]
MTENDRCPSAVQYFGNIKGGMKPAMKITIMGIVDDKPKSFTVSLLCNPNDMDQDVALLLRVNFQEKSIVRNAKFAGIWGTEEGNIPYFPFTAGDNFKMEILCEHQQMRLTLDGQQLCDFAHRVPQLRTVIGLKVTGDIRLTKVA